MGNDEERCDMVVIMEGVVNSGSAKFRGLFRRRMIKALICEKECGKGVLDRGKTLEEIRRRETMACPPRSYVLLLPC